MQAPASVTLYRCSRLAAYLIIIITAISYLYIITRYAVNIPVDDDYSETIPFILEYQNAIALADKLFLIFAPYNDHHVVTNKIVYVLIYSLSGEINFHTMTIVGNLNILALAFLYFRESQSSISGPVIFATVCSLIFQISCTKAALWPMTVLANYTVITFSLLSLIALNRQTMAGLSISIFFASAATFTLASGQLVLLAGVALLLIHNIKSNSPLLNHRMIIWGVASLFIIASHQVGIQTGKSIVPGLIQAAITHPYHLLEGTLTIIGSPFAYNNVQIAKLIGSIGVLSLLILAYFGAWKNQIIFSFCLFLLSSIVVIYLARYWLGLEALVATDRYRFIAINYWICILFLLFRHQSKYILEVGTILMGITFLICFFWYEKTSPEAEEFYLKKVNGLRYWQKTGSEEKLMLPIYNDRSKTYSDFSTLIDKQLYTPPLTTKD